jgi:hypothetical protein
MSKIAIKIDELKSNQNKVNLVKCNPHSSNTKLQTFKQKSNLENRYQTHTSVHIQHHKGSSTDLIKHFKSDTRR